MSDPCRITETGCVRRLVDDHLAHPTQRLCSLTLHLCTAQGPPSASPAPLLSSAPPFTRRHGLQLLRQARHRCQLLFQPHSFHFHSLAPAKLPIRVTRRRGAAAVSRRREPTCPSAGARRSHEGNFQHKDHVPERERDRSANFGSDQNVLPIKSLLNKC